MKYQVSFTSPTPARAPINYEPSAYLPRTELTQLAKGRIIYDREQSSRRLYAVVFGRVKLTFSDDNGTAIVARIISAEGLFGDSALIGHRKGEAAIALDSAGLFSWPIEEVEALIEREPRLGLALLRYVAGQTMALERRLLATAVLRTPERVNIALLELAASLGTRSPDGTVRLLALTHQTLAEYVGTSREVVSAHLNSLRRQQLVRYSREYIDICTGSIETELRKRGFTFSEDIPARTPGTSRTLPRKSPLPLDTK